MVLRKALSSLGACALSLRRTNKQPPLFAMEFSHVSSTGTRNYVAPAQDSDYVSPYQDFFTRINQGKTFLGTTKFERQETKYLPCGVPEDALRFKTTTYGRLLEEPFVHSSEHKVTLQIGTKYLPLNEVEMAVLKQIVGNRLDGKKGVLQLSSKQFGSRIENKRHVVSMLDRVVNSAKDLAHQVPEALSK
jgi:hypothetical protein